VNKRYPLFLCQNGIKRGGNAYFLGVTLIHALPVPSFFGKKRKKNDPIIVYITTTWISKSLNPSKIKPCFCDLMLNYVQDFAEWVSKSLNPK